MFLAARGLAGRYLHTTCRLSESVHPDAHVAVDPSRRLHFNGAAQEFLALGRHYRDGEFVAEKVSVCLIPGASMHAGTGVVLMPGGELLVESALARWRLEASEVFLLPRPRVTERIAGACTTIWHPFAGNYYHWLVEALPRLFTITAAFPGRPLTLLMPDCLGRVQQECLELCLPEGMTVKSCDPRTWYQLDEFLFPTFSAAVGAGYVNPTSLALLRGTVFRKLELSNPGRLSRRIFISRARASRRRLLNEDAVFGILEQHQFERVSLETLGFADQVRLFHEARVIVAPHGAGLSNLIFSGSARVLDLHPCADNPNSCFLFLCAATGASYHHLIGRSKTVTSDFMIDPGDVERALKSLLAAENTPSCV